MKSSLVAISAAAVVATLVTGLKDRATLQERFGIPAVKPAPELMMMGRIKPSDAPAGNADFNAEAVADKIEAITSPQPPAPDTPEPNAAKSRLQHRNLRRLGQPVNRRRSLRRSSPSRRRRNSGSAAAA